MSMMNRTCPMIFALLLCGAAPALAQSTPAAPEHVPLQKTIGQAGPDIVPSLIVMNARGATPTRLATEAARTTRALLDHGSNRASTALIDEVRLVLAKRGAESARMLPGNRHDLPQGSDQWAGVAKW